MIRRTAKEGKRKSQDTGSNQVAINAEFKMIERRTSKGEGKIPDAPLENQKKKSRED